MEVNDLSNIVFYLILALGVLITLLILFWSYYTYKRKVQINSYTKVTGRVVLKGKVEYSGVRVTVGKLKSKEKLAVNPVLNKSREVLRTVTDKKGNFSFNDAPCGVQWFVIEASGYKTILKAIKLQKLEENKINDIILKG